jgi:hypothetical protein
LNQEWGGADLPEGVYFYVIEYLVNSETLSKTGAIHLLK